jgi:hypothetical protein
MQQEGRGARVLQVDRDRTGVVGYALLHGDGSRLQDSSTVVQAREAGLLPGPERADLARLDGLVAELVAGSSPEVARQLAAVGVGAVQVPPGGDPELATTLDLVPGLVRVTEESTLVWRVTPDGPPPGWATVLGSPERAGDRADAVRTLSSTGSAVSSDVGPGDPARTLLLAESADPGWRATLDGRRLATVDADGLQAFALGAEAGALEVSYVSPHRPAWLLVAGVVVLVFALLALPVGRRRGR